MRCLPVLAVIATGSFATAASARDRTAVEKAGVEAEGRGLRRQALRDLPG